MTTENGYTCFGCGQRVYSHQVHDCGYRSITQGNQDYWPIVRATPKEIEIVPAIKVTIDELKRVYSLYLTGKLVEVKE